MNKPDKEFCERLYPKKRFSPSDRLPGHITKKGEWCPGFYVCHHADGETTHLVTDPSTRVCLDVVYDKIPKGTDLGLLIYATFMRRQDK